MPTPALSAWIAELSDVWPTLSRPQISMLAQYSMGMVLARCSGLSSTAFCLSKFLRQSFDTVRERLRDFYCSASDKSGSRRRELDPATCFPGLLHWILRNWTGNDLPIALDATTLSDRFTVLSISVVYRGSAIPVAWKIVKADAKGSWKPYWLTLLENLKNVVPPQMRVIVAADRGLYAKWLYEKIRELKWHPFLRINQQYAKFRPGGAAGHLPLRQLISEPGQCWKLTGQLFEGARNTIAGTVLACWSPGYKEPWVILTDLDPDAAEPAWYGLRAWIERGFKHTKSGGFQWQETRMDDPLRAQRQWLVIAIAQVMAMRQASPEPEPKESQVGSPTSQCAKPIKPPRRPYPILSLFTRGLLLTGLQVCMGQIQPPKPFIPSPWPCGMPICTAVAATQPP